MVNNTQDDKSFMRKDFIREYSANFQCVHEKMPTEAGENKMSWDGKSLKRIMTERQNYSARLRKPGCSFSNNIASKLESNNPAFDLDEMMVDISEDVLDTNRIYSHHKTKPALNMRSLQTRHRPHTEHLIKPTPVFKSKFKESLATPRSTTSQDEANGSITARSMSQAHTRFAIKMKRSVPCLSFQASQTTQDRASIIMSQRLILYFHANGEDLSQLSEFLGTMRDALNVSILAVEYPGYGLYHGEPTEEQIFEDAEGVIIFVGKELNIQYCNIVVVGRSIGSGAAVHLCTKFKLGGLVLISPFTSIKAVIRDKVGLLISKCIKERFNNLDKIHLVQCKVKIIHGSKDELVRPEHSKLLASNYSLTSRTAGQSRRADFAS